MNSKEHLQWAKDRAMEYVKLGQIDNAFTSLVSDLKEQADTDYSMGIMLGMNLKIGGFMSTEQQVTNWINGF